MHEAEQLVDVDAVADPQHGVAREVRDAERCVAARRGPARARRRASAADLSVLGARRVSGRSSARPRSSGTARLGSSGATASPPERLLDGLRGRSTPRLLRLPPREAAAARASVATSRTGPSTTSISETGHDQAFDEPAAGPTSLGHGTDLGEPPHVRAEPPPGWRTRESRRALPTPASGRTRSRRGSRGTRRDSIQCLRCPVSESTSDRDRVLTSQYWLRPRARRQQVRSPVLPPADR